MAYDYIQRAYGLAYKPGQRVKHTVTGHSGEVRRESKVMGLHYVMVRCDGQKHSLPCHPEELNAVNSGDSGE